MPNASFNGFTGTPIEKTDANTRAVFGDYISIYDIQRAVADHATVPIYYESRIAKLGLNASELPKIDAEFEAITEGEELPRKEKLKSKWAAVEALVGDSKRIALVAADLVAHFEKRLEAMDGKAMVVCMSRRICVDLYNALIRLRPNWASALDEDAEAEKGRPCVVKVVMAGSADDGPAWQPHIRNKEKRRQWRGGNGVEYRYVTSIGHSGPLRHGQEAPGACAGRLVSWGQPRQPAGSHLPDRFRPPSHSGTRSLTPRCGTLDIG